MRWLCLIAVLFALIAPAFAVEPDEMLKNPKLEARARDISRELRCMVCQNQSIDDSAAPLARDLRLLVRRRLMAGDTNRQVVDFLVARYGEFVLLKPRFEPRTFLLWGLPPAVLICGAIGLFLWGRRSPPTDATNATLTEAEKARVATLVESPTDQSAV
ncbi:MAG TPA: cytochrome c-type biogenesis protein [Pseudolabrys sp.]|nr:cytochrome c-type biogenesis protein [Pseudolabrys sp.]